MLTCWTKWAGKCLPSHQFSRQSQILLMHSTTSSFIVPGWEVAHWSRLSSNLVEITRVRHRLD